jgi:hypothetical protein
MGKPLVWAVVNEKIKPADVLLKRTFWAAAISSASIFLDGRRLRPEKYI